VLLDGGEPEDERPAVVDRLHGHRIVPAPDAQSVAEANTAGVPHARAPVVALGEDHAFPEPDWAEALLARHEERVAVVGPVVRNANPDTIVSWADFVLAYGAFAVGHPGGDVMAAAGHNSSYKREVLEREGERLRDALAAEWVFHMRLRDQGERVYVEPRAVINHVNFSRPRPFVVHTFRAGRSHAASRAASWSPGRRLVYTLGSVVLPALRLVRLTRGMPSEQLRQVPPLAMLLVLAGLVIDAAGQAMGFARSDPDDIHGNLLELELERVRYVSDADVAALR
jgi:GT2 family glycosyltransferase